jgi:hypothetical protein
MDDRDYAAQPLTVDEFDRLEQKHKHELEKLQVAEAESTKRARINRSENRMLGIIWVVAILAVTAIIFGIGWWIWSETSGPESNGPTGEERREIACVENGGGWVPKDLLAAGAGLCVYPGKSVPVPDGE